MGCSEYWTARTEAVRGDASRCFTSQPPMNTQRIRVAIIDSDTKLRKHLGKLLGKEPDIYVVAEAETGLAGIREVEERKPDVILLDSDNPFTDGLESTAMIVSRFQDARIIVLSMDSKSSMLPLHSKQTLTATSCRAGACFHLCRDCSPEELLAAVREGHAPE
jgi:DNA-binding NarL/FixJ family response regulator